MKNKTKTIIKLAVNFTLILAISVGVIVGNVIAMLSPAIVDEQALSISGEAGQKMA